MVIMGARRVAFGALLMYTPAMASNNGLPAIAVNPILLATSNLRPNEFAKFNRKYRLPKLFFSNSGPLQNGNFEYTPNRSQMNGSRVTGAYAIPYWKVTGFVEYVACGARQGDMVLTVPEGAHAVRLGEDASVSQQLAVTRGAYYSVTFSASRTCAQSERLNMSVVVPGDGAAPSELPIQTVYTTSGWDSYSWAFRAKRGVVSLVIHHGGGGGGDHVEEDPACGPIIDSFAIKKLCPPAATKGNMLRNGDFEEGPYIAPGSPYGVLVPPMDEDDVSPVPGWMVMSYSKAAKYIDAAHFKVPRGSRAVELVAGVEVALVQEVATVPGAVCRLEFSVGDAADGCVACAPPMRVVAAATASGSTTVEYYSRGTGGHTRGKLEFTAAGNRTRVVLYSKGYHAKSDGSGTLCWPVVDDVSLVCGGASKPHARRLLLR